LAADIFAFARRRSICCLASFGSGFEKIFQRKARQTLSNVNVSLVFLSFLLIVVIVPTRASVSLFCALFSQFVILIGSSARPYSTAVPVSDEHNKHQVKSDKSSLASSFSDSYAGWRKLMNMCVFSTHFYLSAALFEMICY
jgi:hypothetical protein